MLASLPQVPSGRPIGSWWATIRSTSAASLNSSTPVTTTPTGTLRFCSGTAHTTRTVTPCTTTNFSNVWTTGGATTRADGAEQALEADGACPWRTLTFVRQPADTAARGRLSLPALAPQLKRDPLGGAVPSSVERVSDARSSNTQPPESRPRRHIAVLRPVGFHGGVSRRRLVDRAAWPDSDRVLPVLQARSAEEHCELLHSRLRSQSPSPGVHRHGSTDFAPRRTSDYFAGRPALGGSRIRGRRS